MESDGGEQPWISVGEKGRKTRAPRGCRSSRFRAHRSSSSRPTVALLYASFSPALAKRRKSERFAVAKRAPSWIAAAAIRQSESELLRRPDSLKRRAAIPACSKVRSRWPSTIRKASSSSAGSIGPHRNSVQATALTTTGSSGAAASRNRASADPRFNMRFRKLGPKWIISVLRRVAERTCSESRPLGVPTHPNLRLGPRLIPGAPAGLATSRLPVMVAARLRYGSLFEVPRISRHSRDAPTLPACGSCQRLGSMWI